MKFDYNDIQKILNHLNFWGILLIASLIVLTFISYVYLKQTYKSAAEETYKKAIEVFKTELSKTLQTQIGLFFRDDSVRNSLLQNMGVKSVDKKIECWQAIYNAYFLYQKSWLFSENTEIKEYTDIDEKLNELRVKIFTETVFLGYELGQKLIRLNSMMKDGLRLKKTEFLNTGSRFQLNNEPNLQTNEQRQSANESKLTELLYETELWLINNLHSDQTLENFEFSKEQLERIKTERDKHFESLTK
jgi:hypothetical protein